MTPLSQLKARPPTGWPAGPSRCRSSCPLLPPSPHASVSAAPLPRSPFLFLCTPHTSFEVWVNPLQDPVQPAAPGAPAAGSQTTLGRQRVARGPGTWFPLLGVARQCPARSDLQRALLGPGASLQGPPSESGNSCLSSAPRRACSPCCVALGGSLALSGLLVYES